MTLDGLAGRLVLRPGRTPSIVCERPMVGAALLGRLTEGRRAGLLPDLLASVFTLCADAQRSTSRRAVKAALGLAEGPRDAAHDGLVLALHMAQEHLQRFALDLPARTTQAVTATPTWLIDAPVMALPPATAGAGEQGLRAAADALPGWLQRRLFGLPAAQWLTQWNAGHGAWLAQWSAQHDHPIARWLGSVREDAQALALPCRALDAHTDDDMRWLAGALADDAAFAERPLWRGAPAETGPWTRHGHADPVATAWDRLGARLADLARIAGGWRPMCGALSLGDGCGIAWTEMSRGLLVHWMRLEEGPRDAAQARAAHYRVLAPTEWNFHPDGAFGRALASAVLGAMQVRLGAAALDPCLDFTLDLEDAHA